MTGKWFFPLVRVQQADWHGCGIAAVATACGVTYERARQEFYPRRQHNSPGDAMNYDDRYEVTTPQVLRVVRKLGFSVVVRRNFLRVPRPTIVPFAWHPDAPNGCVHCVVWDPTYKRFIDPSPNYHDQHLSTDFYLRMWRRSNFLVWTLTGRRR